MLSVISNDPVRLELGLPGAERVYLLKIPALLERAKWRSAIARAGGRYHGQIALLDCLRDGVATLMKDSPEALVGALLGRIEKHRDNLLGVHVSAMAMGEAATDEDRAAFQAAIERLGESGRDLAVVEMEVVQNYPRYAAMVADDQIFWQIAGIEGARLFLQGWEGIDAPFRRLANVIADAVLENIPEDDLSAIGRKLDELSRLSDRTRKNFSTPSSTPSGGEISNLTNTATSGTAPSSSSESTASIQPN
jgi:hypothetical protein